MAFFDGIGIGIGAVAIVAAVYAFKKTRGNATLNKISSSGADETEKRRELRIYLEKCIDPKLTSTVYRRICPVCGKTYDACDRTYVGYGENDKIKYGDKGCPDCHTKVVMGKNEGRYHLIRTEQPKDKKYDRTYEDLSRLVEELRPKVASHIKILIDSIDEGELDLANKN